MPSRRDLLKSAALLPFSTTAAASALTLRGTTTESPAPFLPRPRPAPGSNAPLRIGVIGCGGRGTGAAVQALRADPDTTLVAMGDVFPDRLDAALNAITEEMGDQAATRVQVPPERRFTGFDNYKAVLDAGIDVALLTSYPHFRPLHLAAAIDAGKHVFAEKPLAVDAPGLRSVLASAAAANAKNLSCLVGFCWRYNAGMAATYAKLHEGLAGLPLSVHTTYHTSTLSKRPRQPGWSDMEFQLRNWWHFTWVSGDHIVEQAVHSIDRLAWAMNDETPARVTGLGGRAARSGPESGNAFDHFTAIFEYNDGRRAFHTTRQIDGCPSDNTDYITTSNGSATINGWAPTYLIKDRAGRELWKFSGKSPDMYQAEHDALFAGIRAGQPINDARRGGNSTLMAIMARMAAYTGQTITWDQALNSQERLGPDRYDLGNLPTPEIAIPGKTKFT